uniref:spore coat associated protein CotJA n=1 Tax=Eisenbergiella tayi TaxID=1432052 RepID=UPI003FEE65D8
IILLNINVVYERSFMQDYNYDERLEQFPIAMAYVPWQHMTNICEDLDEAFKCGTIFPELIKPFTGRRCVK